MSEKLDKALAPLTNALCELGDSPEMEADFKRWERNAIIEKCARVVEAMNHWDVSKDRVAAAIRALKDRPCGSR